MNALRETLNNKQRRIQELKKNLGIGVVSNISKDVKEGIHKLGESEM